MNQMFRLIAAVAAGAAAMYYLDPVAGRRRRALVRDKGTAVRHGANEYARIKSRRAANRMRGVVARARSTVSSVSIDDDRLHDRIRAKLGHLVDRPGAVEVDVRDGHVVMTGSVLLGEAAELADAVSSMRGVASVENRLTEHAGYGEAIHATSHRVPGRDRARGGDSGAGAGRG